MARLWTCGFELRSAAALMEVLSVTGTPSISTTVHRGGGASLRSNPTAATAYVEQQLDGSGLNARSFHRFYLYVATLPAVAATVYAVGQSGYFPVHIQVTATGALQLRDSQNAANVGTASAPLTVGTWYRVGLDVQESGSIPVTREVRGYLDGVDFSGAAMIAGSTGYSRVRIGLQTSTSADIHIDDVAVNTPAGTAQNGLPGPGRVVHLVPAGAGDANGWPTAVGGTAGAANNFTRVSEITPDDATSYNQLAATGTTTVDDYTVSSPTTAGIGADDTINVVHVGGRIGSDAATAASIVYRLKSQAGGTVAESSSVSVAVAGWRTHKAAMPYIPQLTSYLDPQTGAAWTRARLAGAQIGVRGDVSQTTVRRVSALWATVDYQPRTVVQLGAAREQNAPRSVRRIGIPTGALVDDFEDGTVDAGKWPDSYGGVTETGGRARVPCTADYAAYASGKIYSLTGSHVVARLYPAAAGGATTEAWSQLLVTSLTAGDDAMIEVDAVGDELHCALRSAPDYSDPGFLALPYDPVAQAWVRIRESGGSVLWETSPDGSAWTIQRTETTPGWADDGTLQVQLIAHRSDGANDYAEFDQFNLPPEVTNVALGAALSTAAARPLAVSKRLTLGVAREQSTPASLGHARTVRLSAAAETSQAAPVGYARTVRLGAARASERAGALARTRTAHMGTAREGISIPPVRAGRVRHLGVARVADGARSAEAGRRIPLTPGQTLDRALPVSVARTVRLGTAREQGHAAPAAVVKAAQLGVAGASEAPASLRGTKALPLSAARSAEQATALGWSRTVRLTAAREGADPRPVMVAGALILPPAVEGASARPLAVRKTVRLGIARETDTARPAASRHTVRVGTARETAIGPTLRSGRAVELGTARECDTVRPPEQARTVALGCARADEAPLPVGHRRTVHLGAARCPEVALYVRQAYQIRLLGAAREGSRACPIRGEMQAPAERLDATTSGPALAASSSGPALTASTTGPRLGTTSTTGG